MSIKSEFLAGQELFSAIEDSSLSSSDQKYQEMVKTAIQHLLTVSTLIDKLSLFSANETLEDINTKDLKYLLVDYYLGELLLKRAGDQRLNIVMSAQNRFNIFLANCLTHQILGKAEKESYERVENPPKDPNDLRKEKIERHKKTKELNALIVSLTKKLQGNKGKMVNQVNNNNNNEDEDDDEEVDRELTLAIFHLFIENTFENLQMVKRELEILQHMEKMKQAGEDPAKKLEEERRAQQAQAKPLKPIVIENTREVLAKQVFQPGWRQPTMTLDEYLELEKQRGNIIEGGGPQQEIRMKQEKEEKLTRDSDADADEEIYKQREFDEFKDLNPRGQGNRYNRS